VTLTVWILLAVAALAGWGSGWLAHATVARELEAENRALRSAIRYAARACPNRPLAQFLWRALGDDEVGA